MFISVSNHISSCLKALVLPHLDNHLILYISEKLIFPQQNWASITMYSMSGMPHVPFKFKNTMHYVELSYFGIGDTHVCAMDHRHNALC